MHVKHKYTTRILILALIVISIAGYLVKINFKTNATVDVKSLIEHARKGDKFAQKTLADEYFTGINIPLNYREAFKWYSIIFKEGDSLPLVNALNELIRKSVSDKDKNIFRNKINEILSLVSKIGENKINKAAISIEDIQNFQIDDLLALISQLEQNTGNNKDNDLSIIYCQLSQLYAQRSSDITFDKEESIRWAKMSLANNKFYNTKCANRLAMAYYEGHDIDYKEAVKWLNLIFMQDKNAQNAALIGDIYFYGGFGVDQDFIKAMKWYKQASKYGSIDYAQERIGIMYDFGMGVERNTSEAAKWYELAFSDMRFANDLKIFGINIGNAIRGLILTLLVTSSILYIIVVIVHDLLFKCSE